MNKIKIKIPAGTIVKYLRKLSIVVIGIAITLSINNWLTTRSEKKDMALYLNAVKLELERNLNHVEWMTGKIEEEVSYSNYLLSHDKNALDPDSIQYYARGGCYAIRGALNIFNAFEMFKASGNMRFIKDKEVLLSIRDAYANLEMYKFQLEEFHNKEKCAEVKKEMQMEEKGISIDVPLYGFYASKMTYTVGCKTTKSGLEEVIAKIETVL
jgi:hypothetical protein